MSMIPTYEIGKSSEATTANDLRVSLQRNFSKMHLEKQQKVVLTYQLY